MRRLIVLTVDTNPDRGPAMCGAFRSVDADSYLYDGIRLASAEDLMMNVSPPTTVWNLVLLHTNNEELWTKFFSATGATAGCMLRYTGGETPQDEPWWIKARSITGRRDALSVSEAAELCDYVDAVLQGEAASLPAVMMRPEPREVLAALAILCQGYLAVHAAHGKGQDVQEFKESLRSMGWEAGKHADLVRGPEKLDAVVDPGWWLDTFELREGGKLNGARWQKFIEDLQGEWGRADGLERLDAFKASLKGQETPSVEAVVQVYNAIVKRLGGGGNTGRV